MLKNLSKILKEMNYQNILNYPTLQEVLAVEKLIKKRDGEFKIKVIRKELVGKINHRKLETIIDYLFHTNKISIDSEGKIGWIYYPKEARYFYNKADLAWKK